MLTLTSTAFEIIPTERALGAFVVGFDTSQPAKPESILRLKQALRDYHILIFKHQILSEEQLLTFATYFGPIFVPPSDVPVLGSKPGKPPVVVTIANAAPEYGPGESFLDNRELLPHSDHQWTPYPSSGSLLYAIDVPAKGGNTHWINLVKAYAELDAATKKQIANLKLKTDNPFLPKEAGSISGTHSVNNNSQLSNSGVPHPLVRTHPESGKKILYLNCSEDVQVVDMEAKAGAQLIEQLRRHINQPRFAYNHQWSVGDLIYWDNQSTLHYRAAFDKNARRVLKRVSLAGSRPF